MVHRLLALLLVSVFVASGCSESESPALPEPDSPTQSARPSVELGAWHALVAGPDGLLLVNGYPETETDPGPLELWQQTVEGWAPVPVTGDRPSGRNFAGIAVDGRTSAVVLHGGLTDEGASSETWRWGADGWTLIGNAGSGPGPRSSPSMAFDASTGVVLLYGGDDGSEQYADTWALTDATWEQVATAGPRPVRWPAAMASDPGGAVVLYGGRQVVDEEAPDAVGDTWVWRRGRWQEVAGGGHARAAGQRGNCGPSRPRPAPRGWRRRSRS